MIIPWCHSFRSWHHVFCVRQQQLKSDCAPIRYHVLQCWGSASLRVERPKVISIVKIRERKLNFYIDCPKWKARTKAGSLKSTEHHHRGLKLISRTSKHAVWNIITLTDWPKRWTRNRESARDTCEKREGSRGEQKDGQGSSCPSTFSWSSTFKRSDDWCPVEGRGRGNAEGEKQKKGEIAWVALSEAKGDACSVYSGRLELHSYNCPFWKVCIWVSTRGYNDGDLYLF